MVANFHQKLGQYVVDMSIKSLQTEFYRPSFIIVGISCLLKDLQLLFRHKAVTNANDMAQLIKLNLLQILQTCTGFPGNFLAPLPCQSNSLTQSNETRFCKSETGCLYKNIPRRFMQLSSWHFVLSKFQHSQVLLNHFALSKHVKAFLTSRCLESKFQLPNYILDWTLLFSFLHDLLHILYHFEDFIDYERQTVNLH